MYLASLPKPTFYTYSISLSSWVTFLHYLLASNVRVHLSDANVIGSSLKITYLFFYLAGLFLYPEYLEKSSGCMQKFMQVFLLFKYIPGEDFLVPFDLEIQGFLQLRGILPLFLWSLYHLRVFLSELPITKIWDLYVF